jgi:hypothetical protein
MKVFDPVILEELRSTVETLGRDPEVKVVVDALRSPEGCSFPNRRLGFV